MQATCNLSLSTLDQIWMASDLPKTNPAHLCFTQSSIAESCHKILVMDLNHKKMLVGMCCSASVTLTILNSCPQPSMDGRVESDLLVRSAANVAIAARHMT